MSAALRERIIGWQAWFERYSYPGDFSNAPPGFDINAFSAEGLAIAEAVKAELPHWTVIYHDEAKAMPNYLGNGNIVPRSEYEYEV